jgi:dihydrofolate reductase
MLTIVAAVAKNGVIGNSAMNKMPWTVPDELAFFRENTLGKTVVMGRKTAEQVGKLKDRRCLLLTKSKRFAIEGFSNVTVKEVLTMSESNPEEELMICGGAQVYEKFMPYASKAIISYMDFDAYGDIMMPKLNLASWKRTHSLEKKRFTAITYTNTNRKKFAIK